MIDKKSCNHQGQLLGNSATWNFSEISKVDKSFSFCPLCGKPLKSSPLDKLLLKTLGLVDSELNPGQRVEDALEALFSSQVKNFDSYLSFDKIYLDTNELVWDVACRGLWFQDKSLKKAVTKALLWAMTELTVEEVEELFQKGADHDS